MYSKFQEIYESVMAEAFVSPNQIVVYKTENDKEGVVIEPPEDFFKNWKNYNTKKKMHELKQINDKNDGKGAVVKYVNDAEKADQVLLSYKP